MSITNRLDRIECEIRHLLDSQKQKIKKKIETVCSSPPKEIENRPNSPRRRSLSVPSQPNSQVSDVTKSNSTKRTRSTGTTLTWPSKKLQNAKNCNDCFLEQTVPNNTSISLSEERKCRCCNQDVQLSGPSAYCYYCCIKKKLNLEVERNKLLESEVVKLKDLVSALNENRKEGTDLSQKWKIKYRNLKKAQKSGSFEQRQSWDSDRVRLSEALDTISKYEKQLLHNKNVSEKYQTLLKSIAEKNKRLEKMEKDLKERDGTISSMCARCKELETALGLIGQKYENLLNTNEKLATNVINKNSSLEAINSETQMELSHYKAQAERYKEEISSLREELSNISQISSEQKLNHKQKVEDLEQTLKETKKREKYTNKLVAILEEKVKDLEKEHYTIQDTYSVKIATMSKEQEMLQERCDLLTEQLSEMKDLSVKRVQSLQSELESFKTCSCSKEEDMVLEKFELTNIIEELSLIVTNQKFRIDEMVKKRVEHEETLNARNDEIKSKEVRIESLESESTRLKQKYAELEEEIKDLKDAINSKLCNCKDGVPTLEKEIKNLRESLVLEKDKFQINEKISDDQTNTIMQLKRKLAEKDDQVAALYRELNTEKSEKNSLNTKLKQLQKDNLSQTQEILRLQNENAMQRSLLDNLERKFELKMKEWKLESELNLTEKEQAIKAAKFTTAQLIQSMKDFEEQSEVQHNIRVLLTNMLQEKDSRLRAAIHQMSSLTLEPNALHEAVNKLSIPKKTTKSNFVTPRNSDLLMVSVHPYEISPNKISLNRLGEIQNVHPPNKITVSSSVSSLNPTKNDDYKDFGNEVLEETLRRVDYNENQSRPHTFKDNFLNKSLDLPNKPAVYGSGSSSYLVKSDRYKDFGEEVCEVTLRKIDYSENQSRPRSFKDDSSKESVDLSNKIAVHRSGNSLNPESDYRDFAKGVFRKVDYIEDESLPRPFKNVEDDDDDDSTNTLNGVELIEDDSTCTCFYRNRNFVCSPNCTKYLNRNKVRKK